MIDVSGKVAVITGASRGLGAGLAERFLAHGLRVGVCARHRPSIADGDRVLALAADVTDSDAVETLCRSTVERFGQIDLWINNAGLLAPIGPLRDNDPAEIARHIEVNVTGVFNGSRTFIRHLHDRDGTGVLLNISSGAARNAYAGWSAYCAAKAAVDRMSESIALEEAEHGLRVHAVAPGVILASTINWDLVAVGLTAAALLLWSRRHPAWAGVLLGLAVAAKFYPVVLLGPWLLLCLRAGRMRDGSGTTCRVGPGRRGRSRSDRGCDGHCGSRAGHRSQDGRVPRLLLR